MSTTTIRIQGTEAQFQQFESQCEVTELMLAQTLCRRFQIDPTQENLGIVAGWMSTARSMGIANHFTSGIHMQMVDDQAKLKAQVHDLATAIPLGEIRQQALDLCHLIEQAGVSPELTTASLAASDLLKAINALMP